VAKRLVAVDDQPVPRRQPCHVLEDRGVEGDVAVEQGEAILDGVGSGKDRDDVVGRGVLGVPALDQGHSLGRRCQGRTDPFRGVARDDDHLAIARSTERVDGAVEERPAVQLEEGLRPAVGQRGKTLAEPGREDDRRDQWATPSLR
jgi:hypothetical protein